MDFPIIMLFLVGLAIVALLVALVVQSHKTNVKLFNDLNNNHIPDELEANYKEAMARADALINSLVTKLHLSAPAATRPIPAAPVSPTVTPVPPMAPVESPTAWLMRLHPVAMGLSGAWNSYLKTAGKPPSEEAWLAFIAFMRGSAKNS